MTSGKKTCGHVWHELGRNVCVKPKDHAGVHKSAAGAVIFNLATRRQNDR